MPRKPSDAPSSTLPTASTMAKMMHAGSTLGRVCRNMIRSREKPSARAATT